MGIARYWKRALVTIYSDNRTRLMTREIRIDEERARVSEAMVKFDVEEGKITVRARNGNKSIDRELRVDGGCWSMDSE